MAAGAVRARPRKSSKIQNFHPETVKYRGRGVAIRPHQTAPTVISGSNLLKLN